METGMLQETAHRRDVIEGEARVIKMQVNL